jgi:PTS system N-acetylglucosamine-specific IIC component
MKKVIARLQPIGRALMLPIAVLPVAALLLRLGQPDLLDVAAIAAAGNAIFSNLGLLFAIGVAIGLARENHGAAGLASVVGYLVTTEGAEVLIQVPPDVTANLAAAAHELAIASFRAQELAKLSVPAGLLSGVIAGVLYNRFSDIRLPSYLAFFGGRRFVPIASGCVGIVLALCFGYGWPMLEQGMDAGSQTVLESGSVGLFAYGVLNRVLIVTGLHHILNNIAWFLLGDYNGVTGDLKRFFAGDPDAGAFMSGFFPMMMFGLPAACLAMYHTALPDKRKAVGGVLFSMALTSFLTGVTEPIEFSFMFLAPALYAIHAVLTGLAMVGMQALGVHLGFGFSAGLFDYLLNFSQATRPLMLIPVGIAYFALYYGVFRYFIARFDLKTLGREQDETTWTSSDGAQSPLAEEWIVALGGVRNLRAVEACTTRLRLVVADPGSLDERALKALGARGVLRLADGAVQVVVGPIADQLASDIRAQARTLLQTTDLPSESTLPSSSSSAPVSADMINEALRALGGKQNLREVRAASSRLVVTVEDPERVDEEALRSLSRALARPSPANIQLIIGPNAGAWWSALQAIREEI